MEKYDLIVIGAGPGGYTAAARASQRGLKTALIERESTPGGVCLNVGCIPSKALLESSELYSRISGGLDAHGIGLSSPELNIPAMMERKSGVVKKLVDGVALLLKRSGVDIIQGEGKLIGNGVVRVEREGDTKEISADKILLAMGGKTIELPFMPFDHEKILTSTDVLSLEKVPERLAVIGAGAIGLELGSVWSRLGSEVTVIEMLPHAAPLADSQASKFLERALKKQGFKFHLSSKLKSADTSGDSVLLKIEDKAGRELELFCDKVLVAIGRKPATESAGILDIGVTLDNTGRIEVNKKFETKIPGVYAIGDLVPGPMLAHKASREGEVFAEQITGGKSCVNYDNIPSVFYTEPELAQTGMTEEEALNKGISVKSGKSYFKGNGRSLCMGSEEGFVKVIIDENSEKILGVHILGPHASELITETVVAIEAGMTAGQISGSCHPHPTLSEVIMEAAMAAMA